MNNPERTVKVLLVDDDEDDIEIFHDVITDIGKDVKIFVAKNGLICMDYLKKQHLKPHIIFLDINMPVKNGIQCLEEIKLDESLKHIKVVMLSTATDQNTKKLALEKGADTYISKSVQFRDLRSSIETCITSAKPFPKPN
jgi:CheY-like chemotaxis protein